MLAAPIVSPIVALSTFAAFEGQNPWLMTSLRLTLGYFVAITVGMIVQKPPPAWLLQPAMLAAPGARRRTGLSMAASPPASDFADLAAASTFRGKLLLAVQSATADFLDVAFFLIIGAAIASVFNTAVNQEIILPFATNPLLAIVSLMILAALLALCSSTDAFIAASFATFPFAAKLAFLLFGPVFDLKLFWLYGTVFKRRFITLLALGLFAAIALICWRISALQF